MQRGITALVVLLILPAAFAAQPVDLAFAVPIVAVIVAAFLAIMFMMASMLSDPRLEAWVKSEIREFAAALILIAIVVAFFTASSGTIGIAAALGGSSTYISSSLNVLDGNWTAGYNSAFAYAVRAAAKIRVGATYSPYLSIPIFYVSLTYSTAPLAGAAILLMPLNSAAGGLTNAIYMTEGIRMLIVFAKATGPTILLPLSLCLRLIPFSRKLGNTMIAVSLAAMVFLPVSVLMADALNSSLGAGYPVPRIKNIGALDANPWPMTVFQPICAAVPLRAILGMGDLIFALVVCAIVALVCLIGYAACFASCFPIMQNWVYPIMMVVFQALNTGLLIGWEAHLGAGGSDEYAMKAFNQLWPFLRDVNNLVFLGYMDFIVIGIITMVGARSLSTALGGEWYLAGIQRLI